MATTGAYLDISGEVKNAYPTGTFPDAVNKEAPYRKSLKKVNLKMHKGIAVFPLNLEAAWNVGITEDNVAFPTPIDPTRVQGTVKPETFTTSFQLGYKAVKTLDSSEGSFQEGGVVSDRIENGIADLGKWINIVYAGTNRGRLGTVEADGTSQITAAKPYGVVNILNNFRIDVYTALTSGSVRDSLSNRKVSAVSNSARTFTYDGADQTAVAGDSIFMTGTYDTLLWTLPDIVDDGTNLTSPFGQSRSTYSGLKSQVFSNGGVLRNLSESLILNACLQTRQVAGKLVNRALSNWGQAVKFAEFVSPDRRYAGATRGKQNYSVGFDALKIVAPGVDCDLEVDYNIPPRALYLLAWETFGLFETGAPDWVDIDDGGPLHLIPSSGVHKAGVLGYAASSENQINTMPRGNASILDLKDPILGDV